MRTAVISGLIAGLFSLLAALASAGVPLLPSDGPVIEPAGLVLDEVSKEKDSLQLGTCYTAGGMAVTGKYDLNLPPEPKDGRNFEVSLHQQVKPNEADRFHIREVPARQQQEGARIPVQAR